MAGIIDADTHIIEHPGVWEHFDPSLYHRRPLLASVAPPDDSSRRDFVWMINGNAVPKRFGKGSYAVAVGGSDSENNRSDIRTEVRYITDPKARVEDMDKRGVDAEVVFPTVLLAYITDDVELEVAICRSYNRYMANAWREGRRPHAVGRRAAAARHRGVRPRDRVRARTTAPSASSSGASRATARWPSRTSTRCTRPPTGSTWPSASTPAAARRGCSRCSTATSPTNLPHVRSLPISRSATSSPIRCRNASPTCASASSKPRRPGCPTSSTTCGAPPAPARCAAAPTPRWTSGPDMFRDYRLYVAAETDEDIPYLLTYIGEDHIIMAPTTATRTSRRTTAWWR